MFHRKSRDKQAVRPDLNGFGPGWQVGDEAHELSSEPFLLRRVTAELSEDRRAILAELLGQFEHHGLTLFEPDRHVGPVPAGTAILHDGKERAICTVAGRGIAEWVRDILDGGVSANELIERVNDILATTPESPAS